MALTPIVSASDGQRVTINSLVKNPLVIPKQIIRLMENQFVVDSVLRRAGRSDSGVWQYNESDPLFADEASTIRQELGEYRFVTTSEGQLQVVVSSDRGLGVMVSDEMKRHNDVDRLNRQLIMLRNTLTRDYDLAFQAALLASSIPTMPASAVWTTTTTDIRKDISVGKLAITQATYGLQANSYFAFVPNLLVCSHATAQAIVMNDSFGAVYRGNLASASVKYLDKLPNQISDLTVLPSRTWPDDKVLICERNTLGFIGDEEPLHTIPMQREEKKRYWWTRCNRNAAIAIDQPKAGIIITGVDA